MTETAYCVKEKCKKEMKDPTKSTTSNGRSCLKGTCKSCGTKMMKFIKKTV